MLCVVSSAFSPPLPLSSISPPLPPSPSTTWPSTRRWRLDRDEMYANARLGSRTFRVCCVIIRKGRSGRRGEGVRRREDWSCNRDRNRRGKRNVPVSINWDVRGTIRCDASDRRRKQFTSRDTPLPFSHIPTSIAAAASAVMLFPTLLLPLYLSDLFTSFQEGKEFRDTNLRRNRIKRGKDQEVGNELALKGNVSLVYSPSAVPVGG